MARADIGDLEFGPRDRRGEWRPPAPIQSPPFRAWPLDVRGFLKFLFAWGGYLYPWNAIYLAMTLAVWWWLTPSLETMATLAPGWIALVWLRNVALMLVVFGGLHLWLHGWRRQGMRYKYSGRWLNRDNEAFLFGDQVKENMFWSLVSGAFFWTAWEVVTLWGLASGWLPWADWVTSPVWCTVLILLVPVIREIHFYLVHRLIHFPGLYRWTHALHHKNINIGPWSGLSMTPMEHFLYFSGVLVYWLVPAHPLHGMYHLLHAAMAPAPGHAGFDEYLVNGGKALPNHNYFHYLHHKHFDVNFGGDGSIPLDKWFGSLHDGTPEADEGMRHRRKVR
jgi:sterol desaturase/sphingolipid hydroxylase (fatty acid hydroxylase superfamily)